MFERKMRKIERVSKENEEQETRRIGIGKEKENGKHAKRSSSCRLEKLDNLGRKLSDVDGETSRLTDRQREHRKLRFFPSFSLLLPPRLDE